MLVLCCAVRYGTVQLPCGSSLVAVEVDAGEILVGHDRDDGRKKGKGGADWQGGSLRESYFRNMDRWGGGRGRGEDDPTGTSGANAAFIGGACITHHSNNRSKGPSMYILPVCVLYVLYVP